MTNHWIRDTYNSSLQVLDSSLLFGTHHVLQKMTKNALVGLVNFWLRLIKILSYKDLR